jgi:hypothetical protein
MKNFFVFLVGALIGAAIVYFICCKPSTLEMVTEPKGIITPNEARALDQAFNSRHQLISDSIVRRPDNRSSWYSLADVRTYLTSAEQQAKTLGYTMNGVRIYLGAHADSGTEVGYTTMFFIPTGTQITAEGSMSFFNMMPPPVNPPDIPGGNGLNGGSDGMPPSSNYPQ